MPNPRLENTVHNPVGEVTPYTWFSLFPKPMYPTAIHFTTSVNLTQLIQRACFGKWVMTAVALNPTCVATHVQRIRVVSLNSPEERSAERSLSLSICQSEGKWHYPGLIPATLHWCLSHVSSSKSVVYLSAPAKCRIWPTPQVENVQ